jgi:hypothetical protein
VSVFAYRPVVFTVFELPSAKTGGVRNDPQEIKLLPQSGRNGFLPEQHALPTPEKQNLSGASTRGGGFQQNLTRKVDNQKTVLNFLDNFPAVVHKKRFI